MFVGGSQVNNWALYENLSYLPKTLVQLIDQYETDGKESRTLYYKKIDRLSDENNFVQKISHRWKRLVGDRPFEEVLSQDKGQGIPTAIKMIKEGRPKFVDSAEIQKLAKAGNKHSIEFLVVQADFSNPYNSRTDFAATPLVTVLNSILTAPKKGILDDSVACFLDAYLKYRPLENLDWSNDYERNLKCAAFKRVLEMERYDLVKIFFKHGLDPNSCIIHNYHEYYHIIFENLSCESLRFWLDAGLNNDIVLIDRNKARLDLLAATVITNEIGSTKILLDDSNGKGLKINHCHYQGYYSHGGKHIPYKGTMLEISVEKRYDKMSELLLKHGAIPTSATIETASLDMVPKLLQAHPNPDDILTGPKGRNHKKIASICNK